MANQENGIVLGMIKGAVKITAILFVGVGVVAAAGFGLSALGVGAADGSILKTAGSIGAGIVSSVTGATNFVADLVSTPVNAVIDMVTGGNENAISRGSTLPEVKAAEGATTPPLSPEAHARFTAADTKIDTVVKALTEAPAAGQSSAIATASAEAQKLAQAIQALGADSPILQEATRLGVLNLPEQVDAIAAKLNAVGGATNPASLQTTTDALRTHFTAVDNNAHGIRAIINAAQQELTTATGALKDQLTTLVNAGQTVLSGPEFRTLYDGAADIRGQVANVLGEVTYPNAAKHLAVGGVAGAAGGAAYYAGKREGAREVVGPHTQALADREARLAEYMQARSS